MPVRRFANQSLEQAIAHIRAFMDKDLRYDVMIDQIAGYCEVSAYSGGPKGSAKDNRRREIAKVLRPRKRKLVQQYKMRQRSKLKRARNGRMVDLSGYTGRTNY